MRLIKKYLARVLIIVILLHLLSATASWGAITGDYTVTSYMGDQTLPPQTGTITIQGDLSRMDMMMTNYLDPKLKDTVSVIIDKSKGVFYWLFYKTRKGFRIKLDSKEGKDFLGKYSDKLKIKSIEDLKNIMPADAKLTELGKRKVNGVNCTGYKVITSEQKTEMWVSTEYSIPVKIITLGVGKTVYNLNKIDKIPDKPASFFAPPSNFVLKDGLDLDFMAEAMGIQIPKNQKK